MLIDEAHVLLGGSSSTAQEGAAEAGASTVKALQNMIVEIRSYGTGIIIADQSPQKVTKEIVGNTDVKIMFQLVQVLYAVALVERIAAFRAEFRRMRRIGGLPAALVAAVDRRACRALRAAL